MVFTSTHAIADDKIFSFGLGIGRSTFQLNQTQIIAGDSTLSNATTFDDKTTSFSLFGGFKFDPYLSMEFDYLDSGKIKAVEARRASSIFKINSLAATVALSTQVVDSTRLFARLGVHEWNITMSADDSSTDSLDLTYGLGADINIYGDLSRQMRVQWNHYEFDGILINSSDSVTISLLFLM